MAHDLHYLGDMNTATKQTKQTKLTAAACELFGVAADKIPGVLFALGLRAACGRCGGSGRHSYCQMYGDRCFGCNGRGMLAAKLTADVLAAARVKVEAGELESLRAVARAKVAARKAIAPLVARGGELAAVIGAAYEVAYKAGTLGTLENRAPVWNAQTLNNSIYYGHEPRELARRESVTAIEWDVKNGRRTDYIACKAEIEDRIAMLETLVAAWRAFEAAS